MFFNSVVCFKAIRTTSRTFIALQCTLRNISFKSRLPVSTSYQITQAKCFGTTLKCLNTNINDLHSNKITEFHGFKCQDPIKGDLVYVGTLHKMVKRIKVFSLTTSMFALALQPLILKKIVGSLSLATALTFMMNVLIFSTPIVLHLITKRYVVNIYHHQPSNTFTASSYSLFLKKKDIKFTPQEVTPPLKPLLFSNLIINNKTSLFIDPSLFLNKDAFISLMKYDDPMDWEMLEEDKEKIRKTGNE